MVFLRLLGNALGTAVMYWGIGLVFVILWFLAALLSWAGNRAMAKITRMPREWSQGLFDTAQEALSRVKFRGFGWVPGIVIQLWYAGYAAGLVRSTTVEASTAFTIALHVAGVLGLAVAAGTFYLLFTWVADAKVDFRIPLAVFLVSLGSYFAFSRMPDVTTALSQSWSRVFEVLLGAFLDSL
jgi:Na+-transporting methylmalonyl-CoA/oxaloacetate decarboxylase gamma subunit